MRIACTSCNAVYDLPPERVTPGRGVKCARCATVWVPVALEDARPEFQPEPEPRPAPDPTPPPAPAPEPVIEPVAARAAAADPAGPVQGQGLALVGWLLTFVVLAGLGWAAVTFRAGLIEAWPPVERAYRVLGLA